MKILIVDDEELTRTGILSSIDWKSLGIKQVFLADDGLHGLEAARKHRPEIILCDVRMPRMDGIAMLEKLETILPDTVPIFMSGYSDKEYLKAAIRLHAVNYIEKPLDPAEIRKAVLDARDQYIQKAHSRRGRAQQSLETGSRLALLLTESYDSSNQPVIDCLADELGLTAFSGSFFTTVIVRLDPLGELSGPQKEEILHAFEKLLAHYHMNCLYIEKRIQSPVYFLFGASRPSQHAMQAVREFLCSAYALCGKYSVIFGETCPGISRAYQSYTSAVLLLQSSFFFPVRTVLSAETAAGISAPSLKQPPETDFAAALSDHDSSACRTFLDRLFACFDHNLSVLPNRVRDLYYKLFLILEDALRQQQITGVRTDGTSIAENMEHCFTYQELHDTLSAKTDQYFLNIGASMQEHPTIFLIREYISRNYMNETLSVKNISEHVFLSASYVCTFFKNETGQTLNQYLTEYRMERAKQLLADPRYKITDISSRVGYSDGNYFGKSFKKYTGFTPSEYREKML